MDQSHPQVRVGCAVLLVVCVTGSAEAFEPLAVESSVSTVRPSISILAGVSERFRADVDAAARTVPDNVWQAIERAGWRLHAAPSVVDAAPWLKGVRPRGWPTGATWENADAVHLPRSRLLVLAEKRLTRDGAVVASDRVDGVLRHELGHAFDMASGGRWQFHSLTPEFSAAYRADVAQLAGRRREALVYYLQQRSAGRQETFAEAFAITLGGGSDVDRREDFTAGFPHVMRLIGHAIAEYQAR